jgi:hypothetical protein
MAYTTINKSSEHFNTKLYEGNGSSPRSITGVGFQPDFTWTKNRDNTNGHGLFDAVRGYATGYGLSTHNANAEGSADTYGYLSSRDSDGYTMTAGGSGMTMNNTNGESYASWNWKANGAGSSNTDGSITSTVSANTTSGFSIVSYTGTGANATVGHGLGVAPKMIIVKRTNGTNAWQIFHEGMGNTKFIEFSDSIPQQRGTTSIQWQDTNPTSTVFSLGSESDVNGNTYPFIAYCFADIPGYSKAGIYTGTGSTNFVYTGFKPTFVMIKSLNYSQPWTIMDTTRDTFNNNNLKRLWANYNNAESTGGETDLLSNGFRHTSFSNWQNVGGEYIYLAFGQSLVGSNNIPCTAR